jgi:SAM-dependent methyltransferase
MSGDIMMGDAAEYVGSIPQHYDRCLGPLIFIDYEIARAKFRPGDQVEFQPADATALPFADGSFDAVVCQFGVMFFPDKDKSYREVFRVLAPTGRYLFNVWDSHRHNPGPVGRASLPALSGSLGVSP